MTDRMGPIEHSAVMPKLSDLEFLSLRMDAAPAPSDMIKGTLIGPVVTPPESNATGTNCAGTNCDKIITAAYIIRRMYFSGILRKVRAMAIAKNTPTPTATEKMRT